MFLGVLIYLFLLVVPFTVEYLLQAFCNIHFNISN
jgi:hypothetical protein